MKILISVCLLLLILNSCSLFGVDHRVDDDSSGPSSETDSNSSSQRKAQIDAFAKRFDQDAIDYIFFAEEAVEEFGVLLEPMIDGAIQIAESRRLTFEPYVSTNSTIEMHMEITNNSENEQDYIQFQCRDILLESDFSVLVFLNGRIAGGDYYAQDVVKESSIDPGLLNGKNELIFECIDESIELSINGNSVFQYDGAPIQEGNNNVTFELRTGGSVEIKVSELILNRYTYSSLD